MNDSQFRVLYRQFLWRIVDLQLVSPGGDMTKLLGQIASLLVFISMLFAFAAMGFAESRAPLQGVLIRAWGFEHTLIATTMLVVGLFAVLSWDAVFPDRQDVLVMGPLPVSASTLFLARIAAGGAALATTIVAVNGLVGLALPLALSPASTSALDLIFSPVRYRLLAAYWLTMVMAGLFVYGGVLALQGSLALLLPRRYFLQLSALLQMTAFCLFVSVYLLQPSLALPSQLTAQANQQILAWLPSYWFLGLLQQLSGLRHSATDPLALRAWTATGVAVCGTLLTYSLAYRQSLRRIVEEPDIVPGSQRGPLFTKIRGGLATAILAFSARALLRSRQHRVMLAFYLGVASASVVALLKSGMGRSWNTAGAVSGGPLFASFLLMCAWVVGMRVVFSMPLALRANWIFRVAQLRRPLEYFAAVGRPLFAMAVLPAWAVAAAVFLSMWPWKFAVGHLVLLGLWGLFLAYVCLQGFRKIPFTCSYLPGKSIFHMAFLGVAGLLLLIGRGVEVERQALRDPVLYSQLALGMFGAVLLVRWRARWLMNDRDAIVEYEETEAPAVQSLGVLQGGLLPGASPRN